MGIKELKTIVLITKVSKPKKESVKARMKAPKKIGKTRSRAVTNKGIFDVF